MPEGVEPKSYLSYGLALIAVLDCTVSDDAGAAAEYCMRYQLLSVTIVTTATFDVRHCRSRVLNWCKLGWLKDGM